MKEIEAEEQNRFVVSIVEALEIPFEWDSNQAMTVLDRVRLRKLLAQYNVSVINDMSGGIKIFLDHEKIGEWKKPFFILKEDLSQIDPKKRLYVEMKCSFESMFEEQES